MSIFYKEYGINPSVGLLELGGLEVPTLEQQEFPFSRPVVTEQVGDRFVMMFPLDEDERLYGLGLQHKEMVINYGVRHLRCDHYGTGDNGRGHAPVPFYVSSNGYGIFVDVAEILSFYMGGTVRKDALRHPPVRDRAHGNDWISDQPGEYVEVSFCGTGARAYMFTGDTMKDVSSQFNLLCGGGFIPPKWGLGIWHRTRIQYDQHDVMAKLDEYKQHGLHMSVLGLEPGWQTNAYPCTFEWDKDRFGDDPSVFVQRLRDMNTRVNLWENMYISQKAGLYEKMLPYSGSHRVWMGIVPDFTMPQARRLLKEQHTAEHTVSGYKIDECDGFDAWLWPDHASFPSGHSATEVRNVYGVCTARALQSIFLERNERTYGLMRANNAGGVSLPYAIYNDCYDFNEFLTGLVTAGFCGIIWVPEVRDAQTSEEWLRRFQLCALSPMLLLNEWHDDFDPWIFKEVFHLVKDAIQLREQLLPYIYTAFYRYQKEGVPPFRAIAMDYGAVEQVQKTQTDHTKNPYGLEKSLDVTDQYLIGDALLVAPMRPGEKERKVVLPGGAWYDFYSNEMAGSNETVVFACPLDRIPLFVRVGGMIPMRVNGKPVVRCFGNQGEGLLYDDDGETYNYQNGEYALFKMRFERKDGKITGGVESLHNRFDTDWNTAIFTD